MSLRNKYDRKSERSDQPEEKSMIESLRDQPEEKSMIESLRDQPEEKV
jgi:hypothetical protein